MSDERLAACKQYIDEMPQPDAAGEVFVEARAPFFTFKLVGGRVLLDDLDEGALSKGGEVGEGATDYLMHEAPLVAVEGAGGS